MSRRGRRLAAFIITLVFAMSVLPAHTTHAITMSTYDAPEWWGGNDCDSTWFYDHTSPHATATVIDTWRGIQACGPNDYEIGRAFYAGANEQLEWQCAELVKRYAYQAFGLPVLPANGYAVVNTYYNAYPFAFRKVENSGKEKGKGEFPAEGAIFSIITGTKDLVGHTGIIKSVNITNQVKGDATLDVLEQNYPAPHQLVMKNWRIRDRGNQTITGWLNPRTWVNDPTYTPTGGLNPNFQAVSALSQNDAWAVGYDYVSGQGFLPLAEHWNGSAWSNQSPNVTNVVFLGVTAISSNEVLAVGYDTSNNKATAFRWDGNSWTQLLVDQPGVDSALLAVATDANGNTWAVGSYQSAIYPYLNKVLMEKYISAGIGFLNPPSNPTVDGQLSGISIHSGTEAWAVGSNSSNLPISFSLDSFDNWQQVSVPLPSGVSSATLSSVDMTDASHVWAVGQSSNGVIAMHWDASTHDWITDKLPDSPSGYYFADLREVSAMVTAEGAYNVLAVGRIRGTSGPLQNIDQTLVLRWKETGDTTDRMDWVLQSNPELSSKYSIFEGVAATATGALAVGQRQDSSYVNYTHAASLK